MYRLQKVSSLNNNTIFILNAVYLLQHIYEINSFKVYAYYIDLFNFNINEGEI